MATSAKAYHVNRAFMENIEDGTGKGKKSQQSLSSTSSSTSSDTFKSGSGCSSCLWQTIEMVETQTKEEEIKINIRNLIVYIVFVVTTCIIAYGRVDVNNFYFPKVVEGRFLDESWNQDLPGYTFRDAGSLQDYWSWIESPLVDGLYWEQWYNGDNVTKYKNYIMSSVKLLGLPRLRQIRVKRQKNGSSECRVDKYFHENASLPACTPKFSSDVEDKGAEGEWKERKSQVDNVSIADWSVNLTAFDYQSGNDLTRGKKVVQWAGAFQSVTYRIDYPDGGYLQNLPANSDGAKAVFETLKNASWIDEGTAAVLIDFTVYNPNVNLFCQVQLMAEFPEFGGMSPSWSFTTVNLFRIETAHDFFILACEGIFILFTVYYIIEELIEISIHRFAYFKKFFNVIDVLIISLAIAWIVFFGLSTYYIYGPEREVTQLIKDATGHDGAPKDFMSLDHIVTMLHYLQTLSAIILFFAWIKFFKFLSFSSTMNQLGETISRSMKDIMFFLIMFFLVFFAFAQFAFLLFGTKLDDFSDFGTCIFTQLRIILGDFDYPALEEASTVFGPIYFFLYIFFVFFVLINMFLAIIADTYSSVKEDADEDADSFVLGKAASIYDGVRKIFRVKKSQAEVLSIGDFVNQNGGVNRSDPGAMEDWRPRMKAQGYTEVEIQAYFASYDVNSEYPSEEHPLPEEDAAQATSREQMNNVQSANLSGRFTSEQQMNEALARVDSIEAQVALLAAKMEDVLDNLKKEANKREAIEERLSLALIPDK